MHASTCRTVSHFLAEMDAIALGHGWLVLPVLKTTSCSARVWTSDSSKFVRPYFHVQEKLGSELLKSTSVSPSLRASRTTCTVMHAREHKPYIFIGSTRARARALQSESEVKPVAGAGDRVLDGDEDDICRGWIGHAGLAARALSLGRYPWGRENGIITVVRVFC